MKKIPKQEYTTEFKEQSVKHVKAGKSIGAVAKELGFKNERVHGLRYETRDEMKAMAFDYIEVLYNRKRQHSTLGYKSPIRFLDDWLVTQQLEKLVA